MRLPCGIIDGGTEGLALFGGPLEDLMTVFELVLLELRGQLVEVDAEEEDGGLRPRVLHNILKESAIVKTNFNEIKYLELLVELLDAVQLLSNNIDMVMTM